VRPVWIGATAAVALATAVALLVVLIGDPSERDLRTAATLVAAILCGGAALAALEMLDRPALQALGALVLLAAAVDFVLFTLGVWKAEPFDGDTNDWVKLIPTGIAWATALIVASTTALLAGSTPRYALPVVGLLAGAWATVATGMVWSETESERWIKLLGALAVLTVGGFLCAPLWRRTLAAPPGP
jgi:hypothetical protein